MSSCRCQYSLSHLLIHFCMRTARRMPSQWLPWISALASAQSLKTMPHRRRKIKQHFKHTCYRSLRPSNSKQIFAIQRQPSSSSTCLGRKLHRRKTTRMRSIIIQKSHLVNKKTCNLQQVLRSKLKCQRVSLRLYLYLPHFHNKQNNLVMR